MRIAALYDIHANLPAIEAVLDEIEKHGVDQIVVGGDVVPGPMPRETIDRLLGLKVPVQFISGNGDRDVLTTMRGMEPVRVPEQFRDVIRWNAQQLRPEHEKLLADWPETICLEAAGIGKVLFCHATPRSDTEVLTRLTPEDRVLSFIEGVDAELIVCGHTHMQFDRQIGRWRLINAGSVGMPFGDPGAYWLLLAESVELRHTRYDLTAAAERVRATGYPQAKEFATSNILQPPSAQRMLELLTAPRVG